MVILKIQDFHFQNLFYLLFIEKHLKTDLGKSVCLVLHIMYDHASKKNYVYHSYFELKRAAAWFQANRLTLNVSKTKFMIFRNKNMHFDTENCKLKIGNEILERIGTDCTNKYFKFVGLKIDEFLN